MTTNPVTTLHPMYCLKSSFSTVSADDVPVTIFASIALQSSHVTVARALTSDVTLDYCVIAEAAEPETVAC